MYIYVYIYQLVVTGQGLRFSIVLRTNRAFLIPYATVREQNTVSIWFLKSEVWLLSNELHCKLSSILDGGLSYLLRRISSTKISQSDEIKRVTCCPSSSRIVSQQQPYVIWTRLSEILIRLKIKSDPVFPTYFGITLVSAESREQLNTRTAIVSRVKTKQWFTFSESLQTNRFKTQ